MPSRNESLPLSTFSLKLIACVTMLIDHTGALFFPQLTVLRIVGRLAMPIYCFLIAEGAVYTHDRTKYLGRMVLFALLSELPFNLMFGSLFTTEHQSVMVTLTVGLTCIFCVQFFRERMQSRLRLLPILAVCALACALAELLRADYGYLGVLMVLSFYFFREHPIPRALALILINTVVYMVRAHITTIPVQIFACAALLPLALYNGKKGASGKAIQYAFYAFYPAHLTVLTLLFHFLH